MFLYTAAVFPPPSWHRKPQEHASSVFLSTSLPVPSGLSELLHQLRFTFGRWRGCSLVNKQESSRASFISQQQHTLLFQETVKTLSSFQGTKSRSINIPVDHYLSWLCPNQNDCYFFTGLEFGGKDESCLQQPITTTVWSTAPRRIFSEGKMCGYVWRVGIILRKDSQSRNSTAFQEGWDYCQGI